MGVIDGLIIILFLAKNSRSLQYINQLGILTKWSEHRQDFKISQEVKMRTFHYRINTNVLMTKLYAFYNGYCLQLALHLWYKLFGDTQAYYFVNVILLKTWLEFEIGFKRLSGTAVNLFIK